MKKVTLIITLVSILLLIFIAVYGIGIGSFQILSISQIIEKNNLLNSKISEASILTSDTYPQSIQKLEESFDNYSIQKQKYTELVGFVDDENNELYETKQYDIVYIWKIFGNYAATRNLTINMDVKKSTGNLYDLNFAVSGTYVNISEFIADLENNSDLYFRIYNFKMTGSSETVSAVFTVKDVNIDPTTITGTSTLQ